MRRVLLWDILHLKAAEHLLHNTKYAETAETLLMSYDIFIVTGF